MRVCLSKSSSSHVADYHLLRINVLRISLSSAARELRANFLYISRPMYQGPLTYPRGELFRLRPVCANQLECTERIIDSMQTGVEIHSRHAYTCNQKGRQQKMRRQW